MFKYRVTTIESSKPMTEAEQKAAVENAKKNFSEVESGFEIIGKGMAKIGEAMSKMFSG